jgi:predicted HAD superfamily Cof-like phosphohydrolase
VTAGLALMFGIPMNEVWNAVQQTNMAKFPDGEVLRNEHGKVIKPEGWEPPDIKAIIEAAK